MTKQCTFKGGCVGVMRGHGLCSAHLKQLRARGDLSLLTPLRPWGRQGCKVDGCQARHFGHGYCRQHLPRPQDCTGPECDAKAVYRDAQLCLPHYRQLRTRDWDRSRLTPLGGPPVRRPKSKPKSTLPAGWHKPTIAKPTRKPVRNRNPIDTPLLSYAPVAIPPDQIERARELIDRRAASADERAMLIDMLGLEAA